MRRGLAAECLEAIVQDLRVLLRLAEVRSGQPTAAILNSRTVQSTAGSGAQAGYDGATRHKGAKHAAAHTLGHLLTLVVTLADTQDRAQVAELATALQDATDEAVELGYADAGYTGDEPAVAEAHGLQLAVVTLPEAYGATRGIVLRPKGWLVERAFPWAPRFRRLIRDDERLAATGAELHFLAFACFRFQQFTYVLLCPSQALAYSGYAARSSSTTHNGSVVACNSIDRCAPARRNASTTPADWLHACIAPGWVCTYVTD